VNKTAKLSSHFDADLIEKIDINKEDPKVKARIIENDKAGSEDHPKKSSEGLCSKCIIC
jgi:hypothetical protein